MPNRVNTDQLKQDGDVTTVETVTDPKNGTEGSTTIVHTGEQSQRYHALDFAIRHGADTPANVVDRAKAYHKFLTGQQ